MQTTAITSANSSEQSTNSIELSAPNEPNSSLNDGDAVLNVLPENGSENHCIEQVCLIEEWDLFNIKNEAFRI